MFFSTKRQQYLIDQGYTFNVNQTIVDKANIESKLLKTKEQEIEMLTMIVADEINMENETYEDKKISKEFVGDYANANEVSHQSVKSSSVQAASVRRTANISNLSGASGYGYAEFKTK